MTRARWMVAIAAITGIAGAAAYVAVAQARPSARNAPAGRGAAHVPAASGQAPARAAVAASAPARSDSAVSGQATAGNDSTQRVVITRESYDYRGSGRRDPFVSLINTEELRPLLADLKLVAIAYDASGGNSVAVLRDVTSKEQYRVKAGQQIGRMRVTAIREKMVVFGIEEFGYSRQETLAMNDSTKVRTQ